MLGLYIPPNVGSVASVSTAPMRHASLVGTGFLDLNAGGRQLKRARGRANILFCWSRFRPGKLTV